MANDEDLNLRMIKLHDNSELISLITGKIRIIAKRKLLAADELRPILITLMIIKFKCHMMEILF